MSNTQFINVNLSVPLVKEITRVLSDHSTLGDFSNDLYDVLIADTSPKEDSQQLTFDFYNEH
jgi:hypothetical protein